MRGRKTGKQLARVGNGRIRCAHEVASAADRVTAAKDNKNLDFIDFLLDELLAQSASTIWVEWNRQPELGKSSHAGVEVWPITTSTPGKIGAEQELIAQCRWLTRNVIALAHLATEAF
jgi:hypothetical protein